MANRLTVVVSQSRSHHPQKRALEEQIVMELLDRQGIDVNVTAHLYDLPADSTGMLCLAGITGDLVVCSWLYPRATRWILDRNGIQGQAGTSLLKAAGEDEEEPLDDNTQQEPLDKEIRVIDQREFPARRIYCLDLRAHDSADIYVEEIERIALEQTTQTVDLDAWIQGDPSPESMARYLSGGNWLSEGNRGKGNGDNLSQGALPQGDVGNQNPLSSIQNSESADRRWYPVIDFSRCTNCLECIDFCLFGVYGLDGQETILVEQPDNCRLGCPACSRVCPENAIIFPQHKAPTIAGSPEVGGSMKIDLSQLFGAPSSSAPSSSPGEPDAPSRADEEKEAMEVAVHERDEQLRLAGREVVGTTIGLAKRQAGNPTAHQPEGLAEKLDQLIDAVDELEL
jgi:hypothetical protein